MTVTGNVKRLYVTAALIACGLAVRGEEPLGSYVSPMADIHVKTRIVSRDMDALKKISNEFAQSYRFAGSEIWCKEPSQLKVVSAAGLVDVVYIINGNVKTLKAGFIRKRWDITHTPGQRQTASTLGLVTPSWVSLLNVTSKGAAKMGGRKIAEYEAHYKEEPRGSYFILFVDTERKYIVRLDQLHGDGRKKVSYRYLAPVKKSGVWVPTKTEVYNADGKRGAVTTMDILSVNSGLSESLFKV